MYKAFLVVSALINLYVLRYLYRLKITQCDCALNWRRKYIMFFICLSLVFHLVEGFDIEISNEMYTVFAVLGLINMVIVLQYIYILKTTVCKCSEHIAREMMYIIAILKIYTVVLLIASVFYALNRWPNLKTRIKAMSEDI